MSFPAGTRLGPYEIVSFIGAGTMGVVYKAHDTRLGRHVAIKVLPPAFANDPDRLARFEREARAVAAINHPNIVSVHDIGSTDVRDDEKGTIQSAYLVTELLDGETLRTRLGAGPLTARKSADVAMQVARGLAAAHDRGIVHRDLKPENIMLQRDGLVKILDFGLAKQSAPVVAAEHDQETIAGTDAGTVLGTVGYMAPEQVRGESAGPRSDLFALGAVLYELASGRRPFARPTAAETMTAILREDPPALCATPPELAASLDRIVRHAIEKEPDERFQSARDFAFALQAFTDTAGSGTSVAARAVPAPRMRARERAAWVAAAVLAIAAVAAIGWPRSAAAPPGEPVVFSPTLPWRDANLDSPAVSPDGRRIAFIAGDRGDQIVVRNVDALQAQPLKGTNGARTGGVFWSPDGRSLGFFAGGKLKTIELATGRIDELADAPSAYGGTWGRDGTILFSPDERAPIFRVSAAGGQPESVTTLDLSRNDEAHRWPQFLPDGRHFVFMPWTAGSVIRTTQLASLDGGPTTALFESESAAIVAGGYFVYVRELPSRLIAQAFHPTTFLPEGRPATVVDDDNISYWWATGEPQISGSATTLVYTTGGYRIVRLTWHGRMGQPLGTVGDADVYYDPTFSPDGQSFAVEKRDPDRKTSDLWTVDLARGTFSRLTSAPGFESVPTWSSDGRRIAYSSDAATGPSIRMKNASGTGVEETLVKRRAFPTDWSRDGRYILFMTDGGTTRQDVWVYDTERRTSTAVLATPFNETVARFSPDGKWIAYVSDETRSAQVYVQSFPEGTTRIQVSPNGGVQPQWRRDGNELFYLAPDTTLMAVDVGRRGADLAIGAPRPLFVTGTEPADVLRSVYSPANDGQRFLLMTPLVPRGTSPLVGVLNWAAGLTRR